MHRSRFSNLVIDCLDAHFETSVAFWAEAFGAPKPPKIRAGQRYVTLKTCPGGPEVLLQKVERDPGVHLDFETDSVVKESARLEAAGGHRKYRVKTWQVMEDPSGTPFCVISKQHPKELERMLPWPDSTARDT